MAKIDAFFKLMNEQGASDLHLASGLPPALRIRGDIERIKYKTLDNDELRAMLYEIAPEDKVKVFEETGDIDFDRATLHARGFFALQTALRFLLRHLGRKSLRYLEKIRPPLQRFLLRHRLARDRHTLFCTQFCHLTSPE